MIIGKNLIKSLKIQLFIFAMGFFVLALSSTPALSKNKTFTTAWYPLDPYQYVVESEGVSTLTGLDVKLLKSYIKKAGYNVKYDAVPWKQHQLELKEGVRDIAAGATWTAEREKYAYFSIPYRKEVNVLYVLKSMPDFKFTNITDFLNKIKQKKLRLGVINGFIYADPRINDYIADPANDTLIVKVSDDQQNITNLLEHKIDGFLADQIVGSTVAWRSHHNTDIKQIMLGISTPIHFMFSKKTVSPKVVEEVNQAIRDLKQSGGFFKIIKEYLFPVLIMQTVDQPWFLIIDILGTIAFAISGLIIAYRERAGLLGAAVFAALPALGGGILRDIIVDRRPIAIMTTPIYILAVLTTVIVSYIILKIFAGSRKKLFLLTSYQTMTWTTRLLNFFDAVGLSSFTVIGVVVCLTARCEPFWLWAPLLAFITSSGGGILRDLITSSRSITSLRGDIYGEISLFWGFVLALFMIWQEEDIQPEQILYAVEGVLLGTLITRLTVIHFGLRSPLFSK